MRAIVMHKARYVRVENVHDAAIRELADPSQRAET
jgi:hypothetical protein